MRIYKKYVGKSVRTILDIKALKRFLHMQVVLIYLFLTKNTLINFYKVLNTDYDAKKECKSSSTFPC